MSATPTVLGVLAEDLGQVRRANPLHLTTLSFIKSLSKSQFRRVHPLNLAAQARLAPPHLTETVSKVVSQKSIPATIRQRILHISNYKG